MEERQPYGEIKIFALTSVNGMLGPGSLTLETIQQVNPRDFKKSLNYDKKVYCLAADRFSILPN